jgi:hypothetical protein
VPSLMVNTLYAFVAAIALTALFRAAELWLSDSLRVRLLTEVLFFEHPHKKRFTIMIPVITLIEIFIALIF